MNTLENDSKSNYRKDWRQSPVIYLLVPFVVLALADGFALGLLLKLTSATKSILLASIVCILSNAVILALSLPIFIGAVRKNTQMLTQLLTEMKNGNLGNKLDFTNNKFLKKLGEHMETVRHEFLSVVSATMDLTTSITDASLQMSSQVKDAASSIDTIQSTIDEIVSGSQHQVEETAKSSTAMDALSNQINIVNTSYTSVLQDTETMNALNSNGLTIVKTLKETSDHFKESSTQIFRSVSNLTATLKNISLFVETIQTIANQTNLLALNAAIEAARAGDSGSGFAVVAEEIRQLAEQSKNATKEITTMMGALTNDSEQVTLAMNSMEDVSNQQIDVVNQTESSFVEIAKAIQSINNNITNTHKAMNEMSVLKEQAATSIENTALASKDAASSSEELVESIEKQLDLIKSMSTAAEHLNDIATQMQSAMNKYHLE